MSHPGQLKKHIRKVIRKHMELPKNRLAIII
uniref:Uncharacterized protein n=1 Tax=Rhizophora mucronata TaxID=61149 RepID=A0A2P2PWR3_RHIMU